MEVSVGPPVVSTHFNDEVVVCELSGEMSSTKEQGYFAADTRLVSGYRLKLGGEQPILLNGAAVWQHSARFEFTNPALVGCDGHQLPEHSLHLRLDRSVGPAVHEDYDLTNQGRDDVVLDLEMSIESDFADLFDVKGRRRVRRGSIHSLWDEENRRLTTRYANSPFERSLVLEVANNNSPPEFANGGILFRVELAPANSWHCCLWWMPVIDGTERRVTRPCHQLLEADSDHEVTKRRWVDQATVFETSNAGVTGALRQAIDDLAGLRLHHHDELAVGDPSKDDPDAWVPAAGIPWFVSLFGRDALTVSFQTLAVSPRFGSAACERWLPSRPTRTTTVETCSRARSNTRYATVSSPRSTSSRTLLITAHTRRPRSTCSWRRAPGAGTETATASTPSDPISSERWPGSIATGTRMATGSRSTRRALRTATTTRAGRTPATPSSWATDRSPSFRSPSASTRASS